MGYGCGLFVKEKINLPNARGNNEIEFKIKNIKLKVHVPTIWAYETLRIFIIRVDPVCYWSGCGCAVLFGPAPSDSERAGGAEPPDTARA
jgi:hypothetical protein